MVLVLSFLATARSHKFSSLVDIFMRGFIKVHLVMRKCSSWQQPFSLNDLPSFSSLKTLAAALIYLPLPLKPKH